MKTELPFFKVGESFGGQQYWMPEFIMRLGGCAAISACDCAIYLRLYKNFQRLSPFDEKNISREDYINFVEEMKPYLHPRWMGVNTLQLYIDGFEKFLRARGEKNLRLSSWFGEYDSESTRLILKYQIDNGYPLPCLMLHHKNPTLKKYEWHWFLLTGYDFSGEDWRVKVVSYGVERWFDFNLFWDTGFSEKGGLIILEIRD